MSDRVIVVDGDATLLYTRDGDPFDVIAVSRVTGVKGEAETAYRYGDVNITRANLGISEILTSDIDSIIGG